MSENPYKHDHNPLNEDFTGGICSACEWEREQACPFCNGNGGGWPDNPDICGGLPCPVCNGVCPVCLGSDDPSTWNLDAMS